MRVGLKPGGPNRPLCPGEGERERDGERELLDTLSLRVFLSPDSSL